MMRATLPVLALFVSAAGVAASPPSKADVQRGAYLIRIMGCNDCHTPTKMGPKGPETDMTRMLTGHPADLKMPSPPDLGKGPWVWAGSASMTAFTGPWGVSYAVNLTPDPETGIGKWTEKMFIEAMRTGRHLGKGRPILPPMPWFSLREATDKDLKAIFAYLRSLPPVKNAAPEPSEPPKAAP